MEMSGAVATGWAVGGRRRLSQSEAIRSWESMAQSGGHAMERTCRVLYIRASTPTPDLGCQGSRQEGPAFSPAQPKLPGQGVGRRRVGEPRN